MQQDRNENKYLFSFSLNALPTLHWKSKFQKIKTMLHNLLIILIMDVDLANASATASAGDK